MNEAKILYRHPDKNVRALEPKALEHFDKRDDETKVYFPEIVNGNAIYTVPIKVAQRLLANQPERYFLIEPASLPVKVMAAGGLTHKHTQVKADPSMLARFNKVDEPDQAEAQAASRAQADADRKAKYEADNKRQAEAQAAAKKKEEDDAAALSALESAPLGDAPPSRPPEL